MNKKKIIIIVLIGIIALLLLTNGVLYILNINKKAVLGYHAFTSEETSDNNFEMTAKNFEKQMKWLYEHNYKTLTLEEFECWKNKTCKQPAKSVLITMDDGYKSNYEVAFPILKKYNMKATVFVVGSNLNLDNPIVLTKEMMDKSKKEYPNIQFASHSYGLHDSFLDDEEKLQADFDAMKGYVSTKYFAYPHGSFNEAYKNVLKKNDYKLAFAFGKSGVKFRKANRSDDNYAVARLCIINEMPMWKFILRMILPL